MNKMEKMNKGKMPAEIGKLFGLLYDGESELLVRIASENLKKQQTQQDGQNQEIDLEEYMSTDHENYKLQKRTTSDYIDTWICIA